MHGTDEVLFWHPALYVGDIGDFRAVFENDLKKNLWVGCSELNIIIPHPNY